VRCPPKLIAGHIGPMMGWFYNHLARLIYAEAQHWKPTNAEKLQSASPIIWEVNTASTSCRIGHCSGAKRHCMRTLPAMSAVSRHGCRLPECLLQAYPQQSLQRIGSPMR
jgi:hypothetical protein